MLRPKRRNTMKPPTKHEMQCESAEYNAAEAAAEGSEKAAKAWENY